MCKWKQLSSWHCCYDIWSELREIILGVWSSLQFVLFGLHHEWKYVFGIYPQSHGTRKLVWKEKSHINFQTAWTEFLVNYHTVRFQISLGMNRIVKTNNHLPSQVFVPVKHMSTNSALWATTQKAVCPELNLFSRFSKPLAIICHHPSPCTVLSGCKVAMWLVWTCHKCLLNYCGCSCGLSIILAGMRLLIRVQLTITCLRNGLLVNKPVLLSEGHWIQTLSNLEVPLIKTLNIYWFTYYLLM